MKENPNARRNNQITQNGGVGVSERSCLHPHPARVGKEIFKSMVCDMSIQDRLREQADLVTTQQVMGISNNMRDAADLIDKLERNLESRDNFIVAKGLWLDFVDSLRKHERVQQGYQAKESK